MFCIFFHKLNTANGAIFFHPFVVKFFCFHNLITPNIILVKAGLMCLNQQKYIYLTFMSTSAVVLQSPAFANIFPLYAMLRYRFVLSFLIIIFLFYFFNHIYIILIWVVFNIFNSYITIIK